MRINKCISSIALKPQYIHTGLEPVLSHIEKSCIASYYRQFFIKKNQNEKHKTKIRFISPGLWTRGDDKTSFNVIIILISAESCL